MSDIDNISNESGQDEEERNRCKMNEFAENYFSMRAKMEKLEKESIIYEAQRERFVGQLTHEILALAVDFYPEYRNIVGIVQSELSDYGELLFDDVANLCEHYKEEKPGNFGPLYEAHFEITTKLDLFKNRTDILNYCEIIEFAKSCFEEEYVEDFYFQCYLKHIHLLLKRLLPDYITEIYSLTAQGFRNLDSFLYVAMLEIFEIINEAEPEEAG